MLRHPSFLCALFISLLDQPKMTLLLFSFESITGLPSIHGYIFIFLFGAVVGSFLNVVIHRVPLEQSIVFPNSKCPKCDAAIEPYDNVPIFSWLALGGKCRACKSPISVRYPAVELLHALLWVLIFWHVGFNPFLPVALIFMSVLVSLMFIDAEHMILPNVITYPFFIFVLIVRAAFPIFFSERYFSDMAYWPAVTWDTMPGWLASVLAGLLGAVAGGGSLWLVGEAWKRLRGVDAMGLGDVKMMLGVGALLGWRLTFLAIFFGAFAGALVGSVLVARQKDKDMQAQIPFGIFLGIGSIISLVVGERLINWYVSTFIP
jgi:leader peptidase (prepilin peptidase) / N-methyltransferase